MKLERRTLKRARIEIVPMIDTILMLLVFYMSFSTFTKREKRFGAKLPVVGTSTTATRVPLDIVLHVKDRNNILVNNSISYDLPGLRDATAQLSAIGQDTTIVIEADPDTSYQDVVSVLDLCAQAHLTRVALRPLPNIMASAQ
ncbi:MAG TPA: biopolymer transporter ExbD [Verrucomicrobiae bacterium]|nr:biopolymer transporter ExbD [Verrucomicrobiae bacterium]